MDGSGHLQGTAVPTSVSVDTQLTSVVKMAVVGVAVVILKGTVTVLFIGVRVML